MAYDPEFDIEYPDAPPIPFDAPAPAAQIPTQPVGQGSAIGTTGGYDPETGDRYTSQFRYNPVQQGGGQSGGYDDLMRQAYEQSMAFLNPAPAPHGNTPYWENPNTYYPHQAPIDPVAQAKASAAIAYKYIAMRGYQQDLKEGKSAADAFSKWGPMLVADTSFGPAVKALQPQPSYKYNQATRAYEAPGAKPVFNPHNDQTAPQFVPANPTTGEPAHYVGGGKVDFIPYNKPITMNEGDKISMTLAKERLNRAENVISKGTASEDDLVTAREQALEAKQEISDLGKRYGFAPSKYNPYVKKASQDFGAMADAQATQPTVSLGWKGGQIQAIKPEATSAPIPLPKEKSELVSGRKYITSKGEATWDGSKFVK